ncbi:MAG: hypothetical protein ACR2P0_02600 [Acidimicrobiales bacterium]
MALGPSDLAYRWLIDAFNTHRRVPREPQTVHQLGAARVELDEARANMAIARGPMRADPPTPDLVDPRLHGSTATSARFLAGFGAVAALGGVVALMYAVSLIGPTIVLVEDSVTESLIEQPDATCDWVAEFTVQNQTSDELRTTAIRARGPLPFAASGRALTTDLAPNGVARMVLSVPLESCPSSVEAVAHGPLRILFENGSSSSYAQVHLP